MILTCLSIVYNIVSALVFLKRDFKEHLPRKYPLIIMIKELLVSDGHDILSIVTQHKIGQNR